MGATPFCICSKLIRMAHKVVSCSVTAAPIGMHSYKTVACRRSPLLRLSQIHSTSMLAALKSAEAACTHWV